MAASFLLVICKNVINRFEFLAGIALEVTMLQRYNMQVNFEKSNIKEAHYLSWRSA